MARYTGVPEIKTVDNPKRRYINVKYPEIPRDNTDIYVYTTKGDRYDLLALSYYRDSSLWWIIARANASLSLPDSLYPNVGIQIRIPGISRISNILATYDALNRIEQ